MDYNETGRKFSELLRAKQQALGSMAGPIPPQLNNVVAIPLSNHATEIRGLKEALENTRVNFDRFAQDVQERITALEMKVGS